MLKFRKSVRVIPGVRLNLSSRGASVSVGGRGATVNVGKRGVTTTASIPGTGLSWSKRTGWSGRRTASNSLVISGMMKVASRTLGQVEKNTDKGNAIVARLNKAIGSLSGGRGITPSKLDTFSRRVSAEEEKMVVLEEQLQEAVALFEAMRTELNGMSFGLFSGGDKKRRDAAVHAVGNARTETKKVLADFSRLAGVIAEKVSEIESASPRDNSA